MGILTKASCRPTLDLGIAPALNCGVIAACPRKGK